MNKIPRKSQAIKDFKDMVNHYKWIHNKDPEMLDMLEQMEREVDRYMKENVLSGELI